MAGFVVLLRGVNVGGNNKVPMAGLRTALTAGGFDDVRTYIQSGNVIGSSDRRSALKTVAGRVTDTIRTEFGVDVRAVALTRSALDAVVDANPYMDEPDPRKVHVLFLLDPEDDAAATRIDDLASAATAKRDAGERVAVIGPAAYLHTPDGFGTSEVAKALSGRRVEATARNWRTVLTLADMVRDVDA